MVAHTGDAAGRLELIEASDLLVVLQSRSTGTEHREIDVIKYAEAIGRSVIRRWIRRRVRGQASFRQNEARTLDGCRRFLKNAEVSMQDDLQTISDKIEKLAGDAKQATRNWWIALLLLRRPASCCRYCG